MSSGKAHPERLGCTIDVCCVDVHSTIVNEKPRRWSNTPAATRLGTTQEGGSLSTQSLARAFFLLALSVALSILVTAIQVSEAHAKASKVESKLKAQEAAKKAQSKKK